MRKINLKKERGSWKIPTPLFFLFSILLILYFIPREGKFRYNYTETKPWQYALLTAPFDFPIHKSEEKIQEERDSIMQSYQPYYAMDMEVAKKNISQFTQDARTKNVPSLYINYVKKKLEELYKAGIMPSEDYESLDKTDKKQLWLKSENNRAATRYLTALYTPKLAYEKVIADMPEALSATELHALNINDYLNSNIRYDEKMSTNVKEDLLSQVVLYHGMVQSGEKIIDRGEIIDAQLKEILDSYTTETDKRIGSKTNPGWLVLGQLMMVSLLVMIFMLYLIIYRPHTYKNQRHVVFMLLLLTIFPIITGIMVDYKSNMLLYIIPFALSTILITTFIDSRTAITVHILTVLICALMVPNPGQFILIQVVVGFICLFSLSKLSERSQLVYSSIAILLTYMFAYTGWILCIEGDPALILANGRLYIYFCVNFVFITFAYLLVYVCERVFGFISEVSMIELANTNNDLLRELSELAPGSFQHSMQVSNLVVPAAIRIGANAPLVRTGALYHDIGKMVNPAFFTENQTEGMNPHQGLTEKESAKIIIGHVAEGVKIAKKHKLPQQIIDFIETHHGTSKARFFYISYANKHTGVDLDEADFTYPGPNPTTCETALVMMADTVEAASRCLKENTKEAITELVHRLIDMQVSEGLFKNAPITLHDIELVKDVFCEKLISMRHQRVVYPELDKKQKEE